MADVSGAVPRTSTHALANATPPNVLHRAQLGWEDATAADRSRRGLSTHEGRLVSREVANDLGLPYGGVTGTAAA
ncbi:hypothetical protein BJF90_13705 [Pseudonocardia sp. CNS-004]|nr:hypothetical protein BJF90_13705 [Pseudonocardia sp. CNS-004]